MEDAIAVYRHLLETMPGTDIILAGDSAGGGIAAAMMHKLQELELPPPTCCILISPWTDLGHDGMRNATLSNADRDFLPPDLVEFCASMTRGDLPHNDWQHSPVFAPGLLHKIPPTLVVYGEDELLAGQIAHFGSVWQQKGASVTLVPVRGMVPSLPGGALVWGVLPMATMAFWAVTLYSHGPRRDPTMQSTEDVNSALSRLLPELNRQIHSDIKDSAGDCEALWDYRTTIGEVLFSSPLSEIYRSCEGSGRLAHITTDRGGVDTDIAVLWATGLKSLELVDALVTPPADISSPSQQWALTLTAMFSNLHIYTKVLVNDKEWLSDYICCDKTLHFTVKASAECQAGIGFSAFQLELVNMDKIDFVQKKQMVLDSGAHASFELDYGTSETVEKAVANFISLKAGALLMRNSDGSTTDTLQTVSEALSAVIELNTGQRCLTHV
ncbi:bah [Symbiodinium sp. CCMP2456]|nr:bah [Symbiodinium sp. CCMP2456]